MAGVWLKVSGGQLELPHRLRRSDFGIWAISVSGSPGYCVYATGNRDMMRTSRGSRKMKPPV
jgi:hypothetical protein